MYVVMLITSASRKEAGLIARKLISDRLAACVNMINGIDSVFWWAGKVDTAKEVLLLVKTKKTNIRAIIKLVRSMHSYEVPEIIALPIIAGERKYLKWLGDSCLGHIKV